MQVRPLLMLVSPMLLCAAALAVVAANARAHGEAHWIETNKRVFKPTTGG